MTSTGTSERAPAPRRLEPQPLAYGPGPDGHSAPPSIWAAATACFALFTVTTLFRLSLFPHVVLPIAYGVPMVLMSWFRRRRFLWLLAAGFAAVTFLKNFYIYPHTIHPEGLVQLNSRVWATAMIVVDLVAITSVLHGWVVVRERSEDPFDLAIVGFDAQITDDRLKEAAEINLRFGEFGAGSAREGQQIID